MKMIKRLIIVAMLMFVPLSIKLTSYLFYSRSGSIFLKHNVARADIIDADGVMLATTIPTKSIYIIPYEIIEKKETLIESFSSILNVPKEYIEAKLNAKSRKFVWIIRHIAPWQAAAIAKLSYCGVYVAKDMRRFYPLGGLFTHIVGRVDSENNGISGIESAFDSRLKATNEPLKLALKASVQSIMKEILDEGKKDFDAQAVQGMIICAKTGRILASYSNAEDVESNPHENYKLDGSNINLNTQSVFEFGSIFKVINVAMLLHNKAATLATKFFAPASWKLGKFTIKDFMRTRDCEYTFTEAFIKSSNIVMGKLTEQIGLEKQVEFFNLCGFFDKMQIDGLQIVPGIFPNPWTRMNGITASYGYGIAVTAAHYVRALLRITTGYDREIHILNDFEAEPEEKIIADQTSRNVCYLLREAFKSTSMGKKYEIAGYNIAGKTGTANKLKNGKYVEKCNRCSYIFVFPEDDPQIIGFVVIDEPKPSAKTFGFATAGWSAAPLACKIIARIIPVLGIPKSKIVS